MKLIKPAENIEKRFQNPVPTRIGGLSIFFKILWLYFTDKQERVPREPLGPFHTDAGIYARPPESGLRVTWFGHSSSLLEIDGARVLIDPVWDERAAPLSWAGPKRFFAPTLPLEDLPAIDAVIISHDHFDHLGEATIKRLSLLDSFSKSQWVTSLGVGELLQEYGVAAKQIEELDWTQTLKLDGGRCTVTSVPARHFSGRSLFNRFQTLWASFVIKGKTHSVYYGADSGWWEGFAEVGSEYGPFDLTMLEIGAFNELWQDIHLGPDGAARAYEALGGPERAGLFMPVHWGLFNLALHGWRQPIERLSELALERHWPLFSPEPGVPTELSAMQSDWYLCRELGRLK